VQAVSLVKAEQSGRWHIAPEGTEIERLATPEELQYDFKWIQRELAAREASDAA
jgi:trehalose 2-sulfotransferase